MGLVGKLTSPFLFDNTMIFEAIEYAINVLNYEMEQWGTLNYHFTTEVRTFNRDNGLSTEVRIGIRAEENGVPTYDPVRGSDRKSILLIAENWVEANDSSASDKLKFRMYAEQKMLTTIMRVLLLGSNSPFIVQPDVWEKHELKTYLAPSEVLLIEIGNI